MRRPAERRLSERRGSEPDSSDITRVRGSPWISTVEHPIKIPFMVVGLLALIFVLLVLTHFG
jgi:hypothetical protein